MQTVYKTRDDSLRKEREKSETKPDIIATGLTMSEKSTQTHKRCECERLYVLLWLCSENFLNVAHLSQSIYLVGSRAQWLAKERKNERCGDSAWFTMYSRMKSRQKRFGFRSTRWSGGSRCWGRSNSKRQGYWSDYELRDLNVSAQQSRRESNTYTKHEKQKCKTCKWCGGESGSCRVR